MYCKQMDMSWSEIPFTPPQLRLLLSQQLKSLQKKSTKAVFKAFTAKGSRFFLLCCMLKNSVHLSRLLLSPVYVGVHHSMGFSDLTFDLRHQQAVVVNLGIIPFTFQSFDSGSQHTICFSHSLSHFRRQR